MKISIALATYNGAKYLPEQLQSFAGQRRQPDELIVSDDGSTDSTVDIVENFARTATFEVRLFRNQKNLGFAGNFNAALRQTTGDLVFLSDQDDVWFPDKIAFIEQLAEKHPEMLIVMNDAILTDAELKEVGLTQLGQGRSVGISDQRHVVGCCCAIRRELLDLCLPIPTGCKSHDTWINRFAEGLGAKLVDKRALQYYRRHGNNASPSIMNRTTKNTKWDLYRRRFTQALRPASEASRLELLYQKQLFLGGITRALSRHTGGYVDQLHTMESETQAMINMLEKRIDICRKGIPARLGSVFAYWRSGGYQQARGILSAIHDLMG